MGQKRRFWFSRTFLIIVGSIFAVLLMAYGWGLQTVTSWKFRHEAKRFPVLGFTPQALPSVQPNIAPGMKLTDAGYVFEVPWDDLDTQKTKYVGKIVVFVFRSGRVVSFFPPGPPEGDLLATAEKSFGDKEGNLRQLFGADAVRSNYAFHKTLLESTPTTLKPWMNQREAIRESFLLLLKVTSAVGGDTGLFNVETNDWKGFQFDDPSKQPKNVTLELYNSNDQHVELIFYNSIKTTETRLTQADINRVVQTLGPVNQPPALIAIPHENTIAAK